MRSKLFVPGSRPELFAKAFAGPADAISLDLEDSVTPERKSEARRHVAEWIARIGQEPALRNGKTVIVRVNAADTIHHDDDMDACVRAGVDIINLPKPRDPQQVRQVSLAMDQKEAQRGLAGRDGLLLNIETPRALRMAAELAGAAPRVAGLQLGLADLFEPAGISRRERSAVEQAMFWTSLAAAEAGVYAYDAAFSNIADPAAFREEAELASRMGFIGKSCIHPSQVALANSAFQPTAEEVAMAERIVAAADATSREGQGVCVVDGKMIDAPFVIRARAILLRAGSR